MSDETTRCKSIYQDLECCLPAGHEGRHRDRPNVSGLGWDDPPYWRVGRKVPINVYEGDRPVCQCHTARDAQRIVEAMKRPSIEEGDRQLILLAIAELALSRPGFDDTLGRIAETLKGREIFDDFKRMNADRVKASHGPFGFAPTLPR